MPRAALNNCKYCGEPCIWETCSRRCKKLEWNRTNPEKVRLYARNAIIKRQIKIQKRWIDKIKNLLPDEFTKDQKIFIAKLVAKEIGISYHKGVVQGQYLARKNK